MSAEQTTEASGIRSLLPLAAIDDYVFEPCGYSMNSQEGRTLSTIHITPEAGFSYASFEISCFADGSVEVEHLVARLSELFLPGEHLACAMVAGLCLLSFCFVCLVSMQEPWCSPSVGTLDAKHGLGAIEQPCVRCWL